MHTCPGENTWRWPHIWAGSSGSSRTVPYWKVCLRAPGQAGVGSPGALFRRTPSREKVGGSEVGIAWWLLQDVCRQRSTSPLGIHPFCLHPNTQSLVHPVLPFHLSIRPSLSIHLLVFPLVHLLATGQFMGLPSINLPPSGASFLSHQTQAGIRASF
jgi:hypothetical protein